MRHSNRYERRSTRAKGVPVPGLSVRTLTDTVGVEVEDLDRERLLGDDALPGKLLELLDAHGVLVFPAMHLDDDDQIRFAERLAPVVTLPSNAIPEISVISLDPAKTSAAEYLRGTFDWHIDGTQDAVPHLAAVATAKVIPADDGGTEFASTYVAYEELEPRGTAALPPAPGRPQPRGPPAPRLPGPDAGAGSRLGVEADAGAPAGLAPRFGSVFARDRGNGGSHRGDGAPGRPRAARGRARAGHPSRTRVPACLDRGRPRHLGQPRPPAPRVSLRRELAARTPPHPPRRHRVDHVADAGRHRNRGALVQNR